MFLETWLLWCQLPANGTLPMRSEHDEDVWVTIGNKGSLDMKGLSSHMCEADKSDAHPPLCFLVTAWVGQSTAAPHENVKSKSCGRTLGSYDQSNKVEPFPPVPLVRVDV